MIKIYQHANSDDRVKIEALKRTFNDFINRAFERKGHFYWVIVANFVTGIGSYNELDRLLTNLISPNKPILLTIIETGKLKTYIENISFESLKITRIVSNINNVPVNADWLRNCRLYKTDPSYPKYKPYVNSKSLLLELK